MKFFPQRHSYSAHSISRAHIGEDLFSPQEQLRREVGLIYYIRKVFSLVSHPLIETLSDCLSDLLSIHAPSLSLPLLYPHFPSSTSFLLPPRSSPSPFSSQRRARASQLETRSEVEKKRAQKDPKLLKLFPSSAATASRASLAGVTRILHTLEVCAEVHQYV